MYSIINLCFFLGATPIEDVMEAPLCSLTGSSAFPCDLGTVCTQTGVNPNYGVTGFDNIAQAFLTVLQCISLEG